jgi:hypothetical protein
MSIYAAIFVGLPRGELECGVEETLIERSFYEFCEDNQIESCPPYYDGSDDAVMGFQYRSAGPYSESELEWNQEEIDKLKEEFKNITGLEAKVYLSPKVF